MNVPNSEGELPEQENYQPEEDHNSGSAYEESSSAGEQVLLSDDSVPTSRCSTSAWQKRKRRSNVDRDMEDEDILGAESRSQTPYTEERIRQDALEWAARFEGPEHGEVKYPTRHASGSRSKKRKAAPPSQARVKRLKGFYSNEYRELLNADIHDAAARSSKENQGPFDESQIGASIWTLKEKELFFSSLSRLGRDDVRGISSQIVTKSEVEVQDYIRLLHQEMVDKDDKRHQLLSETDFPAAAQISEECCIVLERAADALASRQERYEEEVERVKWGESWLLTPDICHWVDKHRREDGGEHTLQEILPAANLLNLKNWLFLSERIFMNPGAPREEDNWQALAEPTEVPAIRATAFTDFHSLAVSITKRLISTTLFCTMSKLRAMDSNKVKQAEISSGDVEAAVKILGLKTDKNEFWIGCARRCNLDIFGDKETLGSSKNGYMTYDEVEMALSGNLASRTSRERKADFGTSSNAVADVETDTDMREVLHSEESEDSNSDNGILTKEQGNESAHNLSTEDEDTDVSLDLSDSEFANIASRRFHMLKKAKLRKANERAREIYTEVFDNDANNAEERRLWSLLRQSPPFEIKSELVELPERPKPNRSEMRATVDWRLNMEYWSTWETMDRPVPSESFSCVAKRKRRRSWRSTENRVRVDEDTGSAVEQDQDPVLTSGAEGDGDVSDASVGEGQPEVLCSGEQRSASQVSISSGRSSAEPSIKSEPDD